MRKKGQIRIASFMLILSLAFGLTACKENQDATTESGQTENVSTESGQKSQSTEKGSTESASAESGSTESGQAELYGSPWIDGIVTGNLPAEKPEAKDNLYLHYNYDLIAEHQGQQYVPVMEKMAEIKTYFAQYMASGNLTDAKDGSYKKAELEQLSILYQQASDLETLGKTGLSEVQPYLDRIKNAKSLSELNEVLAAEDFPFSPYLYLLVSTADLSGVNTVVVYPEFQFVDNMEGAMNYQDSEDENVTNARLQSLTEAQMKTLQHLQLLGCGADEAKQKIAELFSFEKSYGKDAYFSYRYQDSEYGAYSKCEEQMSLDELAALCPNYPVKETVLKFGKGGSPSYSVFEKNWLNTFNSVWTEENLELLKTMTMVKVLDECYLYLDPALYDSMRASIGQPAMDAATNAVTVCDQTTTFAHLISEMYIADHYVQEDIDKLNRLTSDLIASYKEMIEQSSWIDEKTKEAMLLKLKEMRLCILAPDGGYVDFSTLSLTKSEDGGTLFQNYLKMKAWMNETMNKTIGQPSVAQFSWNYYTPDTVNCFYDPFTNSINILPGFTASGMYRSDMSEEELMAKIGWVIGHEIGHGFDFLGSQYDAYGRGESIFIGNSIDAYLEKVKKLVAYLDTMEVLPGIQGLGNGWKTEAGADLIGLEAVMQTVRKNSSFDYEKFFENTAYAYAQVLPSDAVMRMFLYADAHPTNYIRTNVNVQMFKELYSTYDLKEGDGMYLPEDQRIHFYMEEK